MNRYHKAITSLIEILKLRKEIEDHCKIVTDNLTTSEFFSADKLHFELIDPDLVKECFDSQHKMIETDYTVICSAHVGSKLEINERISVHMHSDILTFHNDIVGRLLKEVGTKSIY